MTLLTCAAVRRRLAAFHDRELPVGEMIAIETHIQECPPCAKELRELRSVGDALRAAAAPAPSDDWTGLQSGVISRMRAEAHESLGARAHRMFEDMHLVWIGLASTAATFLCGGIVLSMLQFASPERGDSLAAVIAVMSAPLGSDLNPARLDGFIERAEHGARGRHHPCHASRAVPRKTRSCCRCRSSSRARVACRVCRCSATTTTVATINDVVDAISQGQAAARAGRRRTGGRQPRVAARAHDGQGQDEQLRLRLLRYRI